MQVERNLRTKLDKKSIKKNQRRLNLINSKKDHIYVEYQKSEKPKKSNFEITGGEEFFKNYQKSRKERNLA